ncbi:MAG TPA: C2H2-type zinc finger protein [Nitrososphaera sp.]|nr:C2H2-type zinc finger protein [Nitrososphaera sp.]
MSADSSPSSYNYTCDECGAAFVVMEDLTRHYRQDHPENG